MPTDFSPPLIMSAWPAQGCLKCCLLSGNISYQQARAHAGMLPLACLPPASSVQRFFFTLTPGCPLLQQLMPFTKCVVATGGGAVLRRKNWGFMQHAVVIWLDGSPELLASHVVGQTGGTKSRPLIFSSADVKQQEQVRMLCSVTPLCFLSMYVLSIEMRRTGVEGGEGGGGREL